jgi:zinc protease
MMMSLLSACFERAQGVQPATFRLDNGLEVLVLPDHRAPVVMHMVWYRVGASDDPVGKFGLAHFLEHLMFKGTAAVPNGELDARLNRMGAEHNAFTTADTTAYYQKVARDRLEEVMALEADRMLNLRLEDGDVRTEREVVREERRQRIENNPGAQLSEQLLAALYGSHPYGIPVIGPDETIRTLNREDALRFYKSHYTPSGAMLVLAGDISVADAKVLAQKYYGPLRGEPAAQRASVRPEPLTASVRRSLTHPKVRVASYMRLYAAPTYTTAKGFEAHAVDLAAEILGGSVNSRLYRALVENKGLALNADAASDTGGRLGGAFYIQATPAPGVDHARLEAAIDEVITTFLRDGPTDAELKRAARKLAANAIYAQDSVSELAQAYGSSRMAGEALRQIQNWPQDIQKVPARDVQAAAQTVLSAPAVHGWLLPEAGAEGAQ